MSPATPLPLITGSLSSVVPFFGIAPVIEPTASRTWEIVGAAGAVVSTLNGKSVDGALVAPVVGSVCVAVMSCAPSGSTVDGLNVQSPDVFTVVEPISLPLSSTCTTSPATPLPLITGSLSSVVPFFGIAPVNGPTLSVNPVTLGAAGMPVSTVNGQSVDAGLSLPVAGFACVAVMSCAPSASTVAGLNDQLPDVSTVVEPISLPLSIT